MAAQNIGLVLIALILASPVKAQSAGEDYKTVDEAAGRLSDSIYKFLTLKTGGQLGPNLEEIKMGGADCNNQPKACVLYNRINNVRHWLSEKMRRDCKHGVRFSSTECKSSLKLAKQELDAFNKGYIEFFKQEGGKPNGPPAPMSAAITKSKL